MLNGSASYTLVSARLLALALVVGPGAVTATTADAGGGPPPLVVFAAATASLRWLLVLALVAYHGATCSWPGRWVRCRARLAGAARWLGLAAAAAALIGPDLALAALNSLSSPALAALSPRPLVVPPLPWVLYGGLGAVMVFGGLVRRYYRAGRPRGSQNARVPPRPIMVDHLGTLAPGDRAVAAIDTVDTSTVRRWLDEIAGAIQRLVREQTIALREEVMAAIEIRTAALLEPVQATVAALGAAEPRRLGLYRPRRRRPRKGRRVLRTLETAPPVPPQSSVPAGTVPRPYAAGAAVVPPPVMPEPGPAPPAGPARGRPATTTTTASATPAPATARPRSPTLRWADLPLSESESDGSWTTVGPRGSRRPAPTTPPVAPTGRSRWPTLQEAAAFPVVARRRDPRRPAPTSEPALTPQEQEVRRLRAQIRGLEEEARQARAARASLTPEERGMTKGQL